MLIKSIKVGDTASLSCVVSEKNIQNFAVACGDFNPIHLDAEFAKESVFGKRVAHGMWLGALVSRLISSELPGRGSVYLKQDLKFLAPAFLDDKVEVQVEVIKKRELQGIVIMDCKIRNQERKLICKGLAEVLLPTFGMTRTAY